MKISLLALSLFASSISFADDIRQLAPTVVTATRVEENSFDLPVSIDVVDQKDIKDGQLGQLLSESLIRVPGISAQNRNQMAQDTQIQTRGFGARSAFGVRGIRLYVDGISLSNPDGISNPGNIDLTTLKSIEVMRGPFSALYGSSSGGVIHMRTEDAPKNTELGFSFKAGSYGTTDESIKFTGTQSGVQFMIDTGAYNTNGYRDHSATHKNETTVKLKTNLNNGSSITILASHMNLRGQDPLALKRSDNGIGTTYEDYSVFTSPTKAPSVAELVNTRVHKENTQIGFVLEHKVNENNSINLINSVGHRINDQYSSSSASSSASKQASIGRDFFNNELNWVNKGNVLNKSYVLTSGISYGSMVDERYDRSGTGTNISGTINKSEKNFASNLDGFIQGKLAMTDSFDFHAGARNTNINYDVQTRLNTQKSGGLHFSKTTYVSGATWKVNPTLNIYANYGKGFETPTLAEIAYKNDTSGNASSTLGPNLNIKPSTSDNFELGLKSFITNNTSLNLAIFRTETNNEIVIDSTANGNTSYKNAGLTFRQGLEASIDAQLENNFRLYGAYTYLDAQFDSAYSNIVNGNTNQVNSGNRIPGTYRQQLYGELAWKYPELKFNTALEGRYNSKVFVNDTNSDFADAYTVFNIRAGFNQDVSNWKFSEYLRVENIFDKEYIGSVKINDSNSRFFEASPTRNYLLGLNATYKF